MWDDATEPWLELSVTPKSTMSALLLHLLTHSYTQALQVLLWYLGECLSISMQSTL